ncbi:MAG: cyclic nucleotide-binding domain-containing protein [Gammaproteobacteria bacterium]|nr:cyclic nucleotide-binding domain-containing protein [Gammaproteobacteria bacterium]
MSERSNIEVVKASPLAVDLMDEQSAALADIIDIETLNDGAVLIREGHVDHRLYVVISGELAVTKQSGGGETMTLHCLNAGDLAGAMGFVDGLEHSATLISSGKTEVFSIERQRLEALIATQGELVYQVMRAIIRTGHNIVRRMNNQHVELTNYINRQSGRY